VYRSKQASANLPNDLKRSSGTKMKCFFSSVPKGVGIPTTKNQYCPNNYIIWTYL